MVISASQIPFHALGRAMSRIADLEVPALPKTTFNVGRIGGGTSVNAIASEAWMEVDLRSSDSRRSCDARRVAPKSAGRGVEGRERSLGKSRTADDVENSRGQSAPRSSQCGFADRSGSRVRSRVPSVYLYPLTKDPPIPISQ
jgi:hypothetical protein